eukprot:1338707-Rhodomonas_salina.4
MAEQGLASELGITAVVDSAVHDSQRGLNLGAAEPMSVPRIAWRKRATAGRWWDATSPFGSHLRRTRGYVSMPLCTGSTSRDSGLRVTCVRRATVARRRTRERRGPGKDHTRSMCRGGVRKRRAWRGERKLENGYAVSQGVEFISDSVTGHVGTIISAKTTV